MQTAVEAHVIYNCHITSTLSALKMFMGVCMCFLATNCHGYTCTQHQRSNLLEKLAYKVSQNDGYQDDSNYKRCDGWALCRYNRSGRGLPYCRGFTVSQLVQLCLQKRWVTERSCVSADAFQPWNTTHSSHTHTHTVDTTDYCTTIVCFTFSSVFSLVNFSAFSLNTRTICKGRVWDGGVA